MGDSGGELAGWFPVPTWQLRSAWRVHQPSRGREGEGDLAHHGPAALGSSGSAGQRLRGAAGLEDWGDFNLFPTIP